jgi:hypothetical protein
VEMTTKDGGMSVLNTNDILGELNRRWGVPTAIGAYFVRQVEVDLLSNVANMLMGDQFGNVDKNMNNDASRELRRISERHAQADPWVKVESLEILRAQAEDALLRVSNV